MPGNLDSSIGYMSTKRSNAGGIEINNHQFLVIGGKDADGNRLSSCKYYDTETKEWSDCLPAIRLPQPRSSFGHAMVDGRLYVMGGDIANGEASSDLLSIKIPENYDLSKLSPTTTNQHWTTLAPMKHPRSRFACAFYGNFIYVFGGSSDDGELLNTVECYNIETNEWKVLPSMPEKRTDFAGGLVGTKVYLVGGTNGHERVLGSTLVFDTLLQKWESWTDDIIGPGSIVPTMTLKRSGLSVVAIDSFVIAIGGIDNHGNELGTIEVLDTQTNNWNCAASQLKDSCVNGTALVLPGTQELVVIGKDTAETIRLDEGILPHSGRMGSSVTNDISSSESFGEEGEDFFEDVEFGGTEHSRTALTKKSGHSNRSGTTEDTEFWGTEHTSKSYGTAITKTSGHSIRSVSTPSARTAQGTVIYNHNKFPQDSYSFLALCKPKANFSRGSKHQLLFLGFGLVPFLFQIMFLGLLLLSKTNELNGTIGDADNPDSGWWAKFIPANTNTIILCTQITSILAYVVFPESSLKDVAKAIRLFPQYAKIDKNDRVEYIVLSSALRLFQGVLAMLSALLLVVTSDKVVDIILNFTAVNFISNLDEYAFKLALSGEFGQVLENEAKRIAKKDLPKCLRRDKSSLVYYNLVTMGLVSMILSGLTVFVIYNQKSDALWVTKKLRVQFPIDSDLSEYSGCFDLSNSRFHSRRSYDSIAGIANSTIRYCREERQWVLFSTQEDNNDPCYVFENEKQAIVALSPKTDTFDISSSFDESWVSITNNALDLYFFETDLNCDLSLGDGICDEAFNKFGFGYDEGDCCAAKCQGSNCGREGASAFGIQSDSFTSFANCSYPKMELITIHIDSIKSSRSEAFIPWNEISHDIETEYLKENQHLPDHRLSNFNKTHQLEHLVQDWRKATPERPYFALDCDGKNVLTAYIDPTMVNKSEEVFVEDGARCTVTVRNSVSNRKSLHDAPIWYVEYTLYHGEKNVDNRILCHTSDQGEIKEFKRIAQCFVKDMTEYDGIETIYNAIDWLDIEEDKDNSNCREQFALFKISFETSAVGMMGLHQDHCRWSTVTCTNGKVTELNLAHTSLEESIPDEISFLEHLQVLKLSWNEISNITTKIGELRKLNEIHLNSNRLASIPSEIGLLSGLRTLDLTDNPISEVPDEVLRLCISSTTACKGVPIFPFPTSKNGDVLVKTKYEGINHLELNSQQITAIPSDIAVMKGLTHLRLEHNEIREIPEEIGFLTGLISLELWNNEIETIPSEIGLLTDLTSLGLSHNNIIDIPSEIGRLKNLTSLGLWGNDIATIPNEIGMLTGLTSLRLWSNVITAIPTEIQLLTDLRIVWLGENQINNIPSEIGLLTGLTSLGISENRLRGVPSEIGLLSGLISIELWDNQIKTIPTEIGLLTSLTSLDLVRNEITRIPTEIGLLTGLTNLDLSSNKLSTLPSELGLLTALEVLNLGGNEIESIPDQVYDLCTAVNCWGVSVPLTPLFP